MATASLGPSLGDFLGVSFPMNTIEPPISASRSPQGVHHVSRACDQCHTRKVKCNGVKPCSRCERGGVACSFDKPVLPKGPTPKRRQKGSATPDGVGPSRSVPTRRRVAFYPAPELKTPEVVSPADTDPVGSTAAEPGSASGAGAEEGEPLDVLDPLLWLAEAARGPELARFNLETVFEPPDTHGDDESRESDTSDSESGSEDNDLRDPERRSRSSSRSSTSSIDPGGLSMIVTRGTSRPPMIGDGLFGSSTSSLNIAGFPSGLGSSLGVGGGVGTLGFGGGNGGLGGGGLGGVGFGGFGSSGTYGASGLGMPSPLLSMPFVPPADASPILSLTLETLIKPQLEVFYSRIYPMMPVFSRAELFTHLDDPRSLGNKPFAALVLAKVALSLVHPLTTAEMEHRTHRARQATTLLDEVCRLRSGWEYGCAGSVEAVLTSYCMFGTLFELGHADGARFRLLESIVMGHVMRLGDVGASAALPFDEKRRRMRMYWILAITERAYALQRSVTSIVFTGPIATGAPGDTLADGVSLHHLARVFSFIDADIVVCWNGACPGAGGCRTLTHKRASRILRRLQGTAGQVFGDENGLLALTESQKADLLITWQWIRNRIWRLAALHGLTTKEGERDERREGERDVREEGYGTRGKWPELKPAYPLDVATTTVAICRRLSLAAMEAHGVGFVEKLYDIASTVAELVHGGEGGRRALVQLNGDQTTSMLQALSMFVARHRAGAAFTAPLAEAISVANALRVLSTGSQQIQ